MRGIEMFSELDLNTKIGLIIVILIVIIFVYYYTGGSALFDVINGEDKN
jgi:hypothetical protein